MAAEDDVDYPPMAAQVDRMEPAPRRVRGIRSGLTVFDTTRARYVWEWPYYPQYYVPLDDVAPGVLVGEPQPRERRLGTADRHALRVGETEVPAAALVYRADAHPSVAGLVKFQWDALDAWFEEDEEIFVHPRNPYVRVDALRSHRHLRVELEGLVLAETRSPVLLFETGLPTRYYVDRTDVRFEHLVPTETRSACPYKGTTSGYWSVRVGEELREDLAWSYDAPLAAVRPIQGMVAFYNEKVDIVLDGVRLERAVTHFFDTSES